jgi:hypothetical protein
MMPIPNFRITSLDSFKEVTKEPRQLAGLYFYQLLDCLVDLAYEVSCDFRKRPQLYRQLGNQHISRTLARLNAKYGTDVDFLSAGQRSEIYLPIFDSWNASSGSDGASFPILRNDLLRAVTAFAERAVDTGIEMLREGVRTAHRPFKDYLIEVQGDSVRFSKDVALAELTENNSYPILRDQGVAAVFGIAKHRAVEYPYATDPAEDLLVEQVSTQRTSQEQSQPVVTRERISNLQRAALRGAEAIATALEFEEADQKQSNADLDLMITKCYTWGTALQSLTIVPKPAPSQAVQAVTVAPITSTRAPTGYRQ